jgi:uncharacterized protein with von Willebrand factor type A (vWA) domain
VKYTEHVQFKEHRRWLFEQVWSGAALLARQPKDYLGREFLDGQYQGYVMALALHTDRDPDRIRQLTDRQELWEFLKNGPSWKAKINRDYDRAMRKERDG